ncbi:Phosphatidylinositol transfer protein 3 [Bienertia sinuspersici]
MENSTKTPCYSDKNGSQNDDDEEYWESCSNSSDLDIKVDEEEQRKVATVRNCLLSQHPSIKEVDDLMIRRFLRARNLDVDKASSLLSNYFSWRRSFVPNNYISPSEICNELLHDKVFMQGVDKQGRPIVVTYGARHKPSKSGTDEFQRFAVYCLDKICTRMIEGQEKFVCIADLEGWGYSNSDIRGYIAVLTILQDCYPERLGKVFIVHVPYMFMAIWKAIYPFIDNKTKKKIVFVENKKLRSTLLADIDESELPETYGGKLRLIPVKDS